MFIGLTISNYLPFVGCNYLGLFCSHYSKAYKLLLTNILLTVQVSSRISTHRFLSQHWIKLCVRKLYFFLKKSLFHEFPYLDCPYCNYTQIMTLQCFIKYWKQGHPSNKKLWSLYFLWNLHYIQSPMMTLVFIFFSYFIVNSMHVICPKASERCQIIRPMAIYPV